MKKTAEKATFNWDPVANQTYGLEYGSQTLMQPAPQFNKNYGYSFTMDASGQTLTLQPVTGSDNSTHWGYGDAQEEETQIKIISGTLNIEGDNATYALWYGGLNDDTTSTVVITLANDAVLSIKGASDETSPLDMATAAGPILNVNLEGTSVFQTECTDYTISQKANITQQSRMAVLVKGTLEISSLTEIMVSSVPLSSKRGNAEPALLLQSFSSDNTNPSIQIDTEVEIIGKGQALIHIAGLSTLLQDGATLLVQNNAVMNINSDQITPQGSGAFNVGLGSASINFLLFSIDGSHSPFDFINKKYPQGIFNFITNEGENKGQIVIANQSAAGMRALQVAKLLAVNGEAVNGISEFNFVFQDGDLVISLK